MLARENMQASGLHVGGGDEDDARIGAQAFEVDETLDQILQRIDVERVHVVGRQIFRPGVEPVESRRILVWQKREQPVGHRALQRRQVAADARRAPEVGEPLACFVGSAALQAVGEHHGVDRAGRGAGNALDGKPPVLEQMIEHAPGEGAVRAAALQREVDALLPLRRVFLVTAAKGAGEKFDHLGAITGPSSRRRSNRPTR